MDYTIFTQFAKYLEIKKIREGRAYMLYDRRKILDVEDRETWRSFVEAAKRP